MKISINLELSSLDQVRALEAALSLYVDMETDRLKDAAAHGTSEEKADATGNPRGRAPSSCSRSRQVGPSREM